jgi:hypothetical protein
MKQVFVISLFMSSIWTVQCTSQKSISYEFPEAMGQTVRADFIKQCDKGQILYEINCGGCHTKKINGKKVIPDFTPDQLKGYELRVTNAKHETHLTDESVTAEELGLIMTFLNYKKKNKAGKSS